MKLYYNHFDQSSLKVFHGLMSDSTRDSDWFFDFKTYYVDGKLQMAYLETQIPYDVTVSTYYCVE